MARRPGLNAALAAATLAATLAVTLAACTAPEPGVDLPRRLALLGPVDGFTHQGWFPLTDRDDVLARTARFAVDGVPAERLLPGPRPLVLLHPVAARLLAMPYLSWTWYLTGPDPARHPLRILVGFRDGPPPPPPPDDGTYRPDTTADWAREEGWDRGGGFDDLPPHDRGLEITWGASALQRGSLSPRRPPGADDPDQAAPHWRYVARGGGENFGFWWLETVDLAGLHDRAWPGHTAAGTHIAFVAVALAPEPATESATEPESAGPVAYLSGLVLSR